MVKVIKSGFYSTIQDLGRTNYKHFGVPVTGAMDCYSAAIANAILGNHKNAAVLEMTMIGATLKFCCDTNICISGADMLPKINANAIKLHKSITVKSGDILSFGQARYGFRCYVAVSGGFKTEVVMGSRSMYRDITMSFVLKKNDKLQLLNAGKTSNQNAFIKVNLNHFESNNIEVFKGPEFDYLSGEQQKALFSKSFTISKENNRMAYQLTESLTNTLKPIITSLVLPGTVQLTPSGKLIVLMRDCQTAGGYPRILQLKETSINVLSQKFTGESINFKLLEY